MGTKTQKKASESLYAPKKYVGKKELWMFSLGGLGQGMIYAMMSSYISDYYTNVLQLPLIIEDRSINAPAIELTDYLIYVPKGTRIDPEKYFVSALDSYNNDVSDTLHVENDYKASEEGIYSFHYYATDSLDRRGHSVLLVVVE